MDDPATAAIRKKRNSSIRVAANCVRDGRAEGLVSAGHTGAAMVSAKMVIGTIEGVDRPALATVLPNLTGHCLLLDVGANPDAKTQHFKEFAVMGSIYAQLVFGKRSPSIGLMSIGEEDTKGSDRTKEAFKTLKETGLNFIGNVEGRDVFNGRVDVIVTDGFTGNVILKVSESLAEMVEKLLREEIKRTLQASVGFLLSRTRLPQLQDSGSTTPSTAARRSWVSRAASSSATAARAPRPIKNAIRLAAEFSRQRLAREDPVLRSPTCTRAKRGRCRADAAMNRAKILGTGAARAEEAPDQRRPREDRRDVATSGSRRAPASRSATSSRKGRSSPTSARRPPSRH